MGTRIALAAAALLAAAGDAAAQVYLQLDTGWSWAQNAGMTNDPSTQSPTCLLQAPNPGTGHPCVGSLDQLGSSFVIGGGVGYRLPLGFRVDVTYTNRNGYNLSGSDSNGTTFDPKTTATTVMANGYYDLPVKLAGERVQPYVGGGVGRTRSKVNDIGWSITDPPPESGRVPGGSKTSTAWQLTLGVEVRVTEHWVRDVGYRYADLGKLVTNAGPATAGDPYNAANYTNGLSGKLRANEFLFNVRYQLQ